MTYIAMEIHPPVQQNLEDRDLPYPDYADILSSQDRRCLKGLSPLQTRSWALSRIEQYRACILALGSIHNLATPLHAYLPTEILIHIFGHIRPTSRKEIALAHVCHLWRSVLMRTSAFWAKMLETKIGGSLSTQGAASDSVLRELLERSSPRSLKIYVSEFPPLLHDILLPHFSRITRFKAGISLDNLPDLYEAINAGLPTLNTLEIGLSQHGAELARSLREARTTSPNLVPHLQQSNVPCLRTLVIPGFLFTNSSALLSLTSVELSNCSCHFCKFRFSPRPEVLLRALARTVNLQRLAFQRCLLQYTDFSNVHPTGVALPQLRHFEAWETPAILQDALESISPPPNASIRVRFWPAGVGRSFHELVPRRADYHALLSTVDEVHITASFVETRASSLVLRGYCNASAEPRFSIDMPGRRTMEREGPDPDEPLLVVRDLRRLLESATVSKLEVHIQDGVPGDAAFRQGEWAVLFNAFPDLTTLIVAYRHHCPTGQSLLQPTPSRARDQRDRECACAISDGWRWLLTALGGPADPSGTLACPALQRLELWVVHGRSFADFCPVFRETLGYRNEVLGRRLAHCEIWLHSGRCYADRNLGQIPRLDAPSAETRARVGELLRGLVDEFAVELEPQEDSRDHGPLHVRAHLGRMDL
ncbi:hypothetical protein LXA43DRAFT_937093 [Ganoderma leucocontextum]|nr:hypothetical protein LXA43DRAFT_937093 [Ganoderma leucocontextum]